MLTVVPKDLLRFPARDFGEAAFQGLEAHLRPGVDEKCTQRPPSVPRGASGPRARGPRREVILLKTPSPPPERSCANPELLRHLARPRSLPEPAITIPEGLDPRFPDFFPRLPQRRRP
jgi:hypothetical protein